MSIVSGRGAILLQSFDKSYIKFWDKRLNFSTAFHSQPDGQSESTIQTLEDMLRICMMDFGDQWDVHLPLIDFAYNSSYYASIEMAPYEALYERKYRSPLYWKVGERQLTGLELV